MTRKQQRFIEEYLIDLNAAQAAIRAGYSPHTASEQGAQLLGNLNIKAAVDKAIAERSRRTGVNADRIIRELARIAFAKIDDVIDLDTIRIKRNISEDNRAAIMSIKRRDTEYGQEREVKMHDKSKALEMLSRHLGMFNDKLQLKNALPVIICGENDLQ